MAVYRKALSDLQKWLSSDIRKPLVLRGARQVGKTWLVRELAEVTGRNLVELNFESQRNFASHFESNDPKAILLNLESILNKRIIPSESLLFLDEVQAVPELLAKLRWFYEKMPELPVIAAGSLLEFVLTTHQFSMPVGRINYFFLQPLGFEEFLVAKKEAFLLSAIEAFSFEKPFNQAIHEKANALFKEYMMVGGMPEAVSTWINTASSQAVSEVHNNLINTYRDDFAKYAGKLSIEYLDDVLKAIPQLLTNKVIYRNINPDARHASVKKAVDLLSKSYIAHIVQSTNANGIPLGSEINPKIFKMIFIDIGLVSTMLGLKLYQFSNIDDITVINKGALAEQVVGQLLEVMLPYYIEPKLYYWCRQSHAASAEIDYLIQDNQRLIPIEVKAGSEGKLRSLHQFMSEKHWDVAVRFYSGMVAKQTIDTKTTRGKPVSYALTSLPFYLIEQLYRLIDAV